MKCCDGNCNQGRDCAVRVAKVGYQLRRLGYWMLMAVIGLTVLPMLAYLVLRA